MTRRMRKLAFVCMLSLACAPACADDISVLRSSSDSDAPSTRTALETMLAGPDLAGASGQVRAFYAARDFAPVWSGGDDAAPRTAVVRLTLDHAFQQGLKGSDYTAALGAWPKPPQDGPDAAKFDVAMTTALFQYAHDVRLGRVDPASVYNDIALPPQHFDVAAAFADALKQNAVPDFLRSLPPPHPGYRMLVDALARYRAIGGKGGWPSVHDGKAGNLAQRLAFEDRDLAANPAPTDADLREALIRFQRRNALSDTGKLDADTLKALNVPASYRAREIAANLERWRWLPRGFERRYILVNPPEQTALFIADARIVLASRVVVGKTKSPTPIMRTTVMAVVANPPWDIPDDIAAKQLLPKLRKSPGYLATRNMVLADAPDDPHGEDVDWKSVNGAALPWQIQQSPGPDNVLGTLMLDSPNDFGVYMHDTPDKALFQASLRLHSNGCVRVEKIGALASLALGTDGADGTIKDAVASGQTQRIALPEPLAVYMLYWTAAAYADGTVQFRPDVYGRDPPLIARLGGPSPAAEQIAQAF